MGHDDHYIFLGRLMEYEDNLYLIGNSREVTSDKSPKMVLGKYNLNEQKLS